jgi:uncharacterized membrane protein YkoI
LCGAPLFGSQPPKTIVSIDKARKTALKKCPGTVKSGELEQEKGKWIYSFDITSKDNKTHEVWVDAKTEKILKSTIESASEEAKEVEQESSDK